MGTQKCYCIQDVFIILLQICFSDAGQFCCFYIRGFQACLFKKKAIARSTGCTPMGQERTTVHYENCTSFLRTGVFRNNAVGERTVQDVLQVARTIMVGVGLPPCLWEFAVNHYCLMDEWILDRLVS